jgi:hypothetical protein
MSFHVDPEKTSLLNLRRAPGVHGAVVAQLPQGTPLEKLTAPNDVWWRVRVSLQGESVTGFLNSRFVAPGELGDPEPEPITGDYPECHLRANGMRRRMDRGRAFPLDEPDMPTRNHDAANKSAAIVKIARYLDPENPDHRRYQRDGVRTFCNIYAHDFAMRAGAFFPRVWWTPQALRRIESGERPPVLYDRTVREMNANMLHDWLLDYGPSFGWRRIFEVGALQREANAGAVALIIAKRTNVARSGHVVMIVPESIGVRAAHSRSGEVIRPVQSEAGSNNNTAHVPQRRWWEGQQFQSFGFWARD